MSIFGRVVAWMRESFSLDDSRSLTCRGRLRVGCSRFWGRRTVLPRIESTRTEPGQGRTRSRRRSWGTTSPRNRNEPSTKTTGMCSAKREVRSGSESRVTISRSGVVRHRATSRRRTAKASSQRGHGGSARVIKVTVARPSFPNRTGRSMENPHSQDTLPVGLRSRIGRGSAHLGQRNVAPIAWFSYFRGIVKKSGNQWTESL